MSSYSNSQTTPAVNLSINVTDSSATGNRTLYFGLDPTATDGIDFSLGEEEYPPFPPTGVFDARFIGDDINLPQLGQGVVKDYRNGTRTFIGKKIHEIRYQLGKGTKIYLKWNLPQGVTGLLQDLFGGIVINVNMQGAGNARVDNPLAINKLKMEINYSGNIVSVDEKNTVSDFKLYQNYPNPFNPTTTIQFHTPHSAFITLKLYDILGREVATLVNEPMKAGQHSIEWNAIDLPSGVYLYQLKAGNSVQSKLMVLQK
ncbi:MAG: T9SS type A sorting domain-containing protein [Ignavibacteria bacterium]|nr:T9SS type A sorting domain-containing protein [Ignavibacteria bacterium]